MFVSYTFLDSHLQQRDKTGDITNTQFNDKMFIF